MFALSVICPYAAEVHRTVVVTMVDSFVLTNIPLGKFGQGSDFPSTITLFRDLLALTFGQRSGTFADHDSEIQTCLQLTTFSHDYDPKTARHLCLLLRLATPTWNLRPKL